MADKSKKIPCFELQIDDIKSFVSSVALVERPAIEVDFLAFNQVEIQKFALDDSKMELFGPAMIPDQKIYRIDGDGNEYQVFFSKETIRKIAQSFFKRGFQSQMNIEHTDTNADSYVFQSLIVDKEKGIAPMNLPDGSWVIGAKVLNNDTWKDIKDGKRKGFSVEGLFEMLPSAFKSLEAPIIKISNDEGEEVLQMLSQIQHLIKQKKFNVNSR